MERPDYKKKGLKVANITYILQACGSNFFTSKKLAYGICRRDIDLWHETFFWDLSLRRTGGKFNSEFSYFSIFLYGKMA